MSEKGMRCAIYTRKSHAEGLDQAFNSLDAQREACVDYVKSQKHEGWSVLRAHYDDGGYSGATMERPALKRLFEDIDWSTERVFTQTLERARELTLRVDVLPEFYDIDDARALRRLCSELLDEKSDDVAPATRDFLAGLVARDGRERFWRD